MVDIIEIPSDLNEEPIKVYTALSSSHVKIILKQGSENLLDLSLTDAQCRRLSQVFNQAYLQLLQAQTREKISKKVKFLRNQSDET